MAQMRYSIGAEQSLSTGDHEPLWLNANRYGLSALSKSNGFVRAGVFRDTPLPDSTAKLTWGYGVDVAAAYNNTSAFVVQQAYAEGRWKAVEATIGSKEQPMELKNQELSSGSQTFGANARPIPQLRVGLADYVAIPYTKGWLSIKGHCAYGMTTDDAWQKDFTDRQTRYTEHVLYHSKAAYLRFGRRGVTFELGMEDGCMFGGTSYINPHRTLENKKGLSSFFNALIGGGTDVTDGNYKNTEGNHVGSWNMRLSIDQPAWNLGLYCDQMFEDNSMMVHIAHNGWGERETAHEHVRSRYFIYDFKDGMLGAELKLKKQTWLNNIVVEFLATKYQGGPVYHDVTYNVGEHITGRDNYYNHALYTGWQHWGQVIGNPLFLSPLYNDDGMIEVHNNRFVAWHLGLSGDPVKGLHYRMLASTQKGYGTYYHIYPEPRRNVSLMAEASYQFAPQSRLAGWKVRCAWGMDRGRIYGDNMGVQLSVTKTGLLGHCKQKK